MSRSKIHHPKVSHVCYFSNKKDKRIANRLLRRSNKQLLSQDLLEEKRCLRTLREISDVYDFKSDGLPYYMSKYDIERCKYAMGDVFYRLFMR